MATPTSLRRDLECLWAADTAVDPDGWTADAPSTGHCAITALLVDEYCGPGRILRGVVVGYGSHYWNEIKGVEYDLTRDQFDNFELESEPEERSRDYLLAHPDTRSRYETLRTRLGKHWFA